MPDTLIATSHLTTQLPYASDVIGKMAALGCVRKKELGKGSSGSGGGGGGTGKHQQQGGRALQQQHPNERWVMFNKERFHEIFNETLLHEMTGGEQVSSAGPAAAAASDMMPLNLVLAERRGGTECGGEESKEGGRVRRGGSQVTMDNKEVTAHSISSKDASSPKLRKQFHQVDAAATAADAKSRTSPQVVSGSADQQRSRQAKEEAERPTEGVVCSELVKNRPLVCAALFGGQSAVRGSSGLEVISMPSGQVGQHENLHAGKEEEDEDTVIDPVGSPLQYHDMEPPLRPRSSCTPNAITISSSTTSSAAAETKTQPPITSSCSAPKHLSAASVPVVAPAPSASTYSASSRRQSSSTSSTAVRARGGGVVAAGSSGVGGSGKPRSCSGNKKVATAVPECTYKQLQQQQQKKEGRENEVKSAESSAKEDITTQCTEQTMKRSMEVHQHQRQNWVSLNKTTLYNLVDELVGSKLGSSGEEEEESGGKDTALPTPRRLSSSSRRTNMSTNRKDNTSMIRPNPVSSKVALGSGGSRRSVPNSLADSLGVSGTGPTNNNNKQVLKQCWVALNKTVVFDMVEQAIAQDKEEGSSGGESVLPPVTPAYCDGDCSENSTDSGCTIHKQPEQPPVQVAATSTKKRPSPLEGSDNDSELKNSKKRKRSGGVASRAGLLPCPQRPASAPVDTVKKSQPSNQNNRAPSPYSKEFDVLRQAHSAQCDQLMSEARRQTASSSSARESSSSSSVACPNSTTNASSSSRCSPKLGWVAVSKAEVHTIVDSVMSSLLQQEIAADTCSHSPPPPVLEAQQAPHRPWLDDHPHQQHTSRTPSTSSHPPPSASSPTSSTSSSSPPPHDASMQAARAPFKWKSSLLLRVHEQCQVSPPPPPEDTDTDASNTSLPLDMTSSSSSSAATTSDSNKKTKRTGRRRAGHKTK